MVTVILQLAEVPTPDDAADALAIAISCANAERPGDRANGGAKASVMDRAAVAPITRGETPYERSVREVPASEKAAASGNGKPAAPAAATARRQP